MNEKLLLVTIYDDGTIRLVDGQIIGKLVPEIDFNLIPVYLNKPITTPIPNLIASLQQDNESLRYENQRLQTVNHYHRNGCE